VYKSTLNKPAPVLTCTNECNYIGEEECSNVNPSMHFRICGDYNGDGCLEWDEFGEHYCGWSNGKKLYCESVGEGKIVCS